MLSHHAGVALLSTQQLVWLSTTDWSPSPPSPLISYYITFIILKWETDRQTHDTFQRSLIQENIFLLNPEHFSKVIISHTCHKQLTDTAKFINILRAWKLFPQNITNFKTQQSVNCKSKLIIFNPVHFFQFLPTWLSLFCNNAIILTQQNIHNKIRERTRCVVVTEHEDEKSTIPDIN